MRARTPRPCPSRTAPATAALAAAPRQVNGAVVSGPDLSVEVNGLRLPNPFVIGSGPPGTNYAVMRKAFEEGWGAVIAKTVAIDASKARRRRHRELRSRQPASRPSCPS